MRLIEKYIEWIVAIALSLVCCFDVIKQGLLVVDAKELLSYFTIFNYTILICLLFYQLKHFGIKHNSTPYLCFFIIYYIATLLYMTVLRVYPLDQMAAVPNTVWAYFVLLFRLILYLLCAETIVKRFSLTKFVMIGSVFTLLPSMFYIYYFGVEAIQMSEYTHDDDEYLSGLTMGYNCSPLIVCSVFFYKKIMPSKYLSIVLCSIIIAAGIYVLISLGNRGPILWMMVNIIICYYILKRKHLKLFVSLFIIGFSFYLAKDMILDNLSVTYPKTATRIKATLEEGDTHGRLDFDHPESSTFLIGLNNFYESPLTGSYFRLKTSYLHFRGAYAHNIFVEILSTIGILGLVLFLYLLVISYNNCCRFFRNKQITQIIAFMILFLSSFLMLQTSRSLLLRFDFWLPFYILCSLPRILPFYQKNHLIK